jgi:hypothetical protein
MMEKPPHFAGRSLLKRETIWWVKESHGTIVMDIEKQKYWLLSGFEESLWQLISIQNPFDENIELIEKYFEMSKQDSIELFEKQISQWIDRGILQ